MMPSVAVAADKKSIRTWNLTTQVLSWQLEPQGYKRASKRFYRCRDALEMLTRKRSVTGREGVRGGLRSINWEMHF